MIVSKNDIKKLIPHRDPFVMIDELISVDEQEIVSAFTIEKDNVLNESGGFSDAGLIENIAQTCAAGFGYLDSHKGEEAKLGFIGAINKLKTHSIPVVGETITTKVNMLQQFENVILIKGVNYSGDNALLECEMKIVIIEK